MLVRMAVYVFLAFALATMGSLSADAQKLKNVSPTKYDTRAPAKNFDFYSAMPLAEWRRSLSHQDIDIVSYRSEDKTDWLYGILDRRGKRPKWLLQPHYEGIRELGSNSLAVTRVLFADNNICVLNLFEGDCQETDFALSTPLTYDDLPSLPDWVQPYALYSKTEREHVYDLQLFWTNERPLTIIRNVLASEDKQRPLTKIFALGDRLVVRTVDEADQIRDAVLSRNEDGMVSIDYQPAFSMVEIEGILNPVRDGKVDWVANTVFRNFLPMQTTNGALGLVWPVYENDGEPIAMPEGLLGLLPLTFGYQENRIRSNKFGEDGVSAWYCCEFPLVWAALWEVDDGVAYAVIPQIEQPDYDAVLVSRNSAIYSEIEQLWTPGLDTGYNARDAKARGELIGKYALHRRDGRVDIVSGDKYATKTGSTMIVETSVAGSDFPAWLSNAMQNEAQRQADATAAYNALKAQERARKESYRQALSEQRQRLARERDAARAARQAELDAEAAARDAAEALMPQQWTERVYGGWAIARPGYCNSYTDQTDARAEWFAEKACRERGGNPTVTYVTGSGYDPFAVSAEQCYSARAVTECVFIK
ncbi:MAG: hypothetical protein ACX94B_16980 [Henriciella sp.]